MNDTRQDPRAGVVLGGRRAKARPIQGAGA